jgi:hypothetical protein
MERTHAIEDMAANLLNLLDEVPREAIPSAVEKAAKAIGEWQSDDDESLDIDAIVRRLEERFDVRMGLGVVFEAEDHRPWLADRRGDVDWYYWTRYRRLLLQNRLPPKVVRGIDSTTDQILDHLGDPKRQGKWSRRGMVVGHVQSGKTANYTGLVAKAADAGYRVVVVLGGILNALRNQTQERLDEGFVGTDSARVLDDVALEDKLVGVGRIDRTRLPVTLTTSRSDFNADTARKIGMGLGALSEPLMLVIKKNTRTLDNAIHWLKSNNLRDLKDFPMLLIDDEADHASINTAKQENEATAINTRIRRLLALFDRSTYVGYTATPFANIFIDPDTDDQMYGQDLFPRDFILSLDPPSNYVGPMKVFSSQDDGQGAIVEVDDHTDSLPIRHKKGHAPEKLPASMKEAVRVFVLASAIRAGRGDGKKHSTMMVNVSRFTDVQTNVRLMLEDYVQELRDAVVGHAALSTEEALRDTHMSALHDTWDERNLSGESVWHQLQTHLRETVNSITVIEVNSSATAEPLDYSYANYPNGRRLIAIGGMNLSRGLTLEGLCVSYFLRNSVMYDTLMQMGRWFGYRDHYEDLCRIYMTADAASWYRHIAEATEELRSEFRQMKARGMAPKDFGLCVRSHPESLIVTARNKMRSSHAVPTQIGLEGRLAETAVLFRQQDIVTANRGCLDRIIGGLVAKGSSSRHGESYLWKRIESGVVTDFLEGFTNHPGSVLTQPSPLVSYTNAMADRGTSEWDVLLTSVKRESETRVETEVAGLRLNAPIRRNTTDFPDNGIALNRRRLASRGSEKAGIKEKLIASVDDGRKNVPDRDYRAVRERPLLMLYLIDCRSSSGPDIPMFKDGIPAFGVSFPGSSTSRTPESLVTYVVNTVWWRDRYADLVEEEEDEIE